MHQRANCAPAKQEPIVPATPVIAEQVSGRKAKKAETANAKRITMELAQGRGVSAACDVLMRKEDRPPERRGRLHSGHSEACRPVKAKWGRAPIVIA